MNRPLSTEHFEAWLDRYGAAWQARDAEAFVALFAAADLRYYWSPFTPARKSHAELTEAFQAAVRDQRDVHFGFQILALHDDLGIAHWRCKFTRPDNPRRMTIDGILSAEFRGDVCGIFREWWHSDEFDESHAVD